MERKVAVFENGVFGKIRVFSNEGIMYFCLLDLCKVLGIKNAGDIKKRLDTGNNKNFIYNETLDTTGRRQQVIFVNEITMYKIVFQSRKPKAEELADWITTNVMTSFWREKTNLLEDVLANPDFCAKILEKSKKTLKIS